MRASVPARWIRRRDCDWLFDGPRAYDWAAILACPDPYVVKDSLRRSVLRIPGPPGSPAMYLKVFRPMRLRETLGLLLRPSRAAWEYRMAHRLREAGIPAAAPIAHARLAGGWLPRGSLYLGWEIPRSRPLSTVLASEPPLSPPVRRRLLEAYGTLLGRIHRQGFYAHDLFADNVLVEGDPAASFTLRVIDLHSTRPWLGRLRWFREKNLVPALGSTARHQGPGDRRAFLRAYGTAGIRAARQVSLEGVILEGFVEDLDRRMARRLDRDARRRFRRRTRKLLHPGERFGVERRGRLRLWYRRDVGPDRLHDLARAAEAMPPGASTEVPEEGAWLLHRGRRADVVGVRRGGDDVAVKVFHDARPRTRWRTCLGHGKGRRALRGGWGLEVRRLRGPRVLGYVERRPFGPGFLVTERLVDHEGLRDRLPGMLARGRTRRGAEELAILARELGRFTATLHHWGVTHRDYSARNILVEGSSSAPRFALVDLEDLRFAWRSSPARRRRDLHTLADDTGEVPLRERLRFLRHYLLGLGEQPSAAHLARRLARERGA